MVDEDPVRLPKSSRTGLYVGLGLVALVLVAGVVVFGQGSGSDTPPPPVPKPAPTEQVKPSLPAERTPEAKPPETQPGPPATGQAASAEGSPTPAGRAENPSPGAQSAEPVAGTPPSEEPAKDEEPEPPEVQKLSPEAEYAELMRRAKKLIAGGKYKTAVFSLRRALALKPDSDEAKAGLGIALVSSDPSSSGYREATRLLEDSLKTQPNNARAWLCLGMARQMTQQDKKAVEAYKRYLLLEPTGPFANDVRAALKQLGQ
jgi:hypothetical protein